MMQTCYNHNFMLILEKQEKYEGHPQFFAVVQIIGSPKEAKGFAYKLELNGNNKRKLTYEASPRSIHEGVAAAINSSDCLIFDPSIAKLFAENGNLGINVTISQIWFHGLVETECLVTFIDWISIWIIYCCGNIVAKKSARFQELSAEELAIHWFFSSFF